MQVLYLTCSQNMEVNLQLSQSFTSTSIPSIKDSTVIELCRGNNLGHTNCFKFQVQKHWESKHSTIPKAKVKSYHKDLLDRGATKNKTENELQGALWSQERKLRQNWYLHAISPYLSLSATTCLSSDEQTKSLGETFRAVCPELVYWLRDLTCRRTFVVPTKNALVRMVECPVISNWVLVSYSQAPGNPSCKGRDNESTDGSSAGLQRLTRRPVDEEGIGVEKEETLGQECLSPDDRKCDLRDFYAQKGASFNYWGNGKDVCQNSQFCFDRNRRDSADCHTISRI